VTAVVVGSFSAWWAQTSLSNQKDRLLTTADPDCSRVGAHLCDRWLTL